MWSRGELPPSVQELVGARIDSLEMMQVLLVIREQPDRSWTLDMVRDASSMDEAAISGALVKLRQRGFLSVELAGDTRYRYAASGDLAAAVDDLRECYRTRPLDLAAFIASRPQKRLRLFADAFRLRKDD
jgi:hypothetical protein